MLRNLPMCLDENNFIMKSGANIYSQRYKFPLFLLPTLSQAISRFGEISRWARLAWTAFSPNGWIHNLKTQLYLFRFSLSNMNICLEKRGSCSSQPCSAAAALLHGQETAALIHTASAVFTEETSINLTGTDSNQKPVHWEDISLGFKVVSYLSPSEAVLTGSSRDFRQPQLKMHYCSWRTSSGKRICVVYEACFWKTSPSSISCCEPEGWPS